ncbi:PaaI family thioesterase, partial [Tropicimonas sp. TH_r6]|uniref:PaaI family thioesterase n=1 Tax=Tropicimonas sp. TH_r6 TaxID=3082085 RepID=UPI002953BE52
MTETPLEPQIVDKIRKSFDAQSLMKTLGAELGEMSPGKIEVLAPILPGAQQQNGFAHAGLTFSLGDVAAGYAALSMMPAEADVLTVEIKINLLSPAKGDRLIARGYVIKPGRRLFVVGAEVLVDQNGTLKPVAMLQ